GTHPGLSTAPCRGGRGPDRGEAAADDEDVGSARGVHACPPIASGKPVRQLGYIGSQPSSRLAFAFEAPRTSVSHVVAAAPAASRASHLGTRRGGRAFSVRASTGSHSRIGAGSSSTTW